jgi:ABC-type proline/glycine betaine transport system ATPase subunit
MPDVLHFISEMKTFYDKYHLLQPESRAAFQKDIAELHHRLSRTSVVVERDVGSISRRMQAMQTHFTKWMEDPMHQGKHWKLHPSDDFMLFASQSKIILARMQHEVLTHQILG